VSWSPQEPIFALATPPAASAIAVIRVSGNRCLSLLSGLLGRPGRPGGTRGSIDLSRARGFSVRLAAILDGDEEIDEVLVTVFRSPRSYTGEDSAEISCHGGLPVIRRILSLLGRGGFRQAGPGEFTQRAFLNGKMDLTRAEAVNEIVRARTDRARDLALRRLCGAVESRIDDAREAVLDALASLEARLDYPEEELDGQGLDMASLARAEEGLSGLAGTFRRGRIYQEGATVAVAGATNAGKSSLFNQLLREDRAIVSEIHGTTRDWLEAEVSLEGVPVRLVDTAGLRDCADPLEREGMRRAVQVTDAADLVLYLVDAAAGLGALDREFLERPEAGSRVIPVWNKTDLAGAGAVPDGFTGVSAATGDGVEALGRLVASRLLDGPAADHGQPLIDSERQRDLIGRALERLASFRAGLEGGVPLDALALDLRAALDALGEITGAVSSADVLERLFGRFCVGK